MFSYAQKKEFWESLTTLDCGLDEAVAWITHEITEKNLSDCPAIENWFITMAAELKFVGIDTVDQGIMLEIIEDWLDLAENFDALVKSPTVKDSLDELLLAWVKDNKEWINIEDVGTDIEPEQVFSHDKLTDWATDNGFKYAPE